LLAGGVAGTIIDLNALYAHIEQVMSNERTRKRPALHPITILKAENERLHDLLHQHGIKT
jgi:hypothetical protein